MNVFDFAMELERSGSAYYRSLAENALNDGQRTIYSMMASDEEKLEEKFRAMKAVRQATTMEDSAVLEYVENPFEGDLDAEKALGAADDLDAYHYVIRVEENICRLYEEAAREEGNPEVKTLLLKIAEEERRELESLRRVYNFVNAPNEFLAWQEFSNLDEFHNFGRDEDL